MRDMIEEINIGTGIYPTMIFASEDMYRKFEAYAEAKCVEEGLISESADTANFTTKRLKLTIMEIPVVRDKNCPAHHMYFINSDGLRFNVLADNDFKVKYAGKDIPLQADVWCSRFIGNFSLSRAQTQGVIYLE